MDLIQMINFRDICLKITRKYILLAHGYEKRKGSLPPARNGWNLWFLLKQQKLCPQDGTSTTCAPQMVGWGDQNPNSEEERLLPCSRESSDFPLEDSGWN